MVNPFDEFSIDDAPVADEFENLDDILRPTVSARRASRQAFLAGLAVSPDQSEYVANKVEGEYILDGASPTIDMLLQQDAEGRYEARRQDLTANLNANLGPFQDIAEQSSSFMKASAILDELNIIKDEGVTRRGIAGLAFSNQASQPQQYTNPEVIRIQDQLRNSPDGGRWTPEQFLGLVSTPDSFTDADRNRIVQELFPITDKERGNTFSQLTNFAASAIIPGPYTAKINYVLGQMFPELNQEIWDARTTVENTAWVRERIRNMGREEFTATVKRGMQAAEEAGAVGFEANFGTEYDGDDIQVTDIVMTILDDLGDEATQAGTKQLIDTIITAADVIPLVTIAARRTAGVVRPLVNAGTAHLAMRANRPIVREYTRQILAARAANPNPDVPTQLERDLQASLEDLLIQGMPRPAGSGSRGNVSIVDPFDITLFPNAGVDNSLNNLSPAELQAMKSVETARTTASIETTGAVVHPQNTEIGHVQGGITLDIEVGSTLDHGYARARTAIAAGDALEAPDRLVMYERRNPITGEVERLDRERMEQLASTEDIPFLTGSRIPNPNEYTIRVQETRYVSPEHTLASEQEAAAIGVSGWMAKFLNKSSLYQKWFTNASNIAEADADVLTQTLRGIRETYTALGALSRRRADNVINYMDENGVDLDVAQIMDRVDHDINAARGVLAVRKWADALHYSTNNAARKELLGWRAQVLTFRSPINNRTDFLARPVLANDVNPNQFIYNPETGMPERISRDAFQDKIDQGYQLYELRRAEIQDRQQFKYVWHKPGEGATTVGAIPHVVVPRIPGYMPRIYNANYMVARIVDGVDATGAPMRGRIPLSLHNNIEQANRDKTLRAALNGEDEEGMKVLGTRELEALNDEVLLSTSARNSIDYLEYGGQLFTTARGRLLTPVTEHAFDGSRRPLKDILETMEIAEYKVGNRAINNLVRVMTARWEKAYVERYGLVNPVTGRKEMPIWGDLPKSAVDANDDITIRPRALADRDHIQLIAGVDRTAIRQWWAEKMTNASNNLVSRYSPDSLFYNLGDRLIKGKYVTPLDMLRRLNFVRSIVWAPFRQLPLQFSSAGLHLAAPHALTYLATGRLTKDMVALVTYNLVKDLPDANEQFARWARQLGIPEEDYRVLGEQFERTGFMQSIDSHSYAVGNYNSATANFAGSSSGFSGRGAGNALARAATSIGRGAKTGNDFLRRIGFDVGEKGQQMVAFLVERNRYIQEGKRWTDPEVFAQIIGDTRARTLNMSRTGSTALNRGGMGVVFQFMQWNMRVLQALLPRTLPLADVVARQTRGRVDGAWYKNTIGKLGDETFTNQEKFRMALLQSMMWGVGGWGFVNLHEDAMEMISEKTGKPINMPPEVAEAIREGVVGEGLNMLVRANFNDDSSILFSSSFSPVAGFAGNLPSDERLDSNPVTRLIEGLLLQNYNSLWDLVGPSTTTFKAAWNSTKYAYAFMGMPLVGTDGASLPFNPQESPGLAMDSILRFAPMYNNYMKGRAAWAVGRIVTDSGELGVHSTKGEAIIQGILGIRSADQDEVQMLTREALGRIDVKDGSDWREVQDAAKIYYDYSVTLARRAGAGEIDADQMYTEMQEHSGMINYMIENPVERQRFWEFVADKVRSDLNSNKEMELASAITHAIGAGNIPATPESITKINNMQHLDEDTRKTAVDFLTTYMELARNGRLSSEQP